jgi:glycosyltransferase involved in cell wall biosynthesis
MSASVAVVIPYFEDGQYLPDSVRSVLAQTFNDLEIVVVDDGSVREQATEVLAAAGLDQIRVITLPNNSGTAAARNAGIRATDSSLIVILDADDLIEPTFIAEALEAFAGGTYGAVYTQVKFFGEYEGVFAFDITLTNLLARLSGVSSFLLTREAFDSVGGFRQGVIEEDMQFWIALCQKGWKFKRIEKALYHYRQRPDGMSRRHPKERMRQLVKNNLPLYQQHCAEIVVALEDKYLDLLSEYRKVVLESRKLLAIVSKLEQNDTTKLQRAAANAYFSEFRTAGIARQLTRLTSSLSWAITRPLRKTKLALRKLTAPLKSKIFHWPTSKTEFSSTYNLVADSGLFDEQFYRDQCQARDIKTDDPIAHYIESGWKIGLDPNPFFSSFFYRLQFRSINESQLDNPLVHYLCKGAQLGLPTGPLFDTSWYVQNYPDVRRSQINPLFHFLQFGFVEGRQPTSMSPGHSLAVPAFAGLDTLTQKKLLYQAFNRATVTYVDECAQPYDLILGIHEASRTGAPMLGLALAREFKERGRRCLILLLRAGEMVDLFLEEFDVINLASMNDAAIALGKELSFLRQSELITAQTPVLLNSAELHPLYEVLSREGFQVTSLVHEFLSNYPLHTRRHILEQSSALVFSCQATLRDALADGQPEAQTHVLAQGLLDFTLQPVQRDVARCQLHTEFGISPESFIILACGTADLRKGIDLFARTAVEVIQQERQSDIQFIWVGGEHHSQGVQPWPILDIKQAGLENSVHFVGAQEDLSPFFAAADVFLLPSRQDPMPCVMHLAMAAAVPTVAFTNSGGAEEVLAYGGGCLVPYGDTAAMAAAVREYHRNEPLRSSDGAKARQLVLSQHRMSDYCDRLEAIFDPPPSSASAGHRNRAVARALSP